MLLHNVLWIVTVHCNPLRLQPLLHALQGFWVACFTVVQRRSRCVGTAELIVIGTQVLLGRWVPVFGARLLTLLVGRLSHSVAYQPVTVWIVDDEPGGLDPIDGSSFGVDCVKHFRWDQCPSFHGLPYEVG